MVHRKEELFKLNNSNYKLVKSVVCEMVGCLAIRCVGFKVKQKKPQSGKEKLVGLLFIAQPT